MKLRSAGIQGALALAGLTVAYATWQRDPQAGGTDVVVLDLTRNQVQKIRYDDVTRYAELQRLPGQGDPEIWVRVGDYPPPPPPAPDGGTPDAGLALTSAHPALALAPERELRGNEAAVKLYERFAPLRASRALGTLPAEKLKELGLADSKRRVEVTAAGAKHVFRIGTPASGLSTPYLFDEGTQKAYLLGGTLVMDLEAAQSRLVDRRLHTFKPSEIDTVAVKAGEKQREFAFSGGDNGQNAKLVPKGAADQPDEFARNWHDKIWRLIPIELLGKGEVPLTGAPKVAVRVDYSFKGKSQGWVELAQTSPSELFARSEFTAGWLKIHAAGSEDLLQEANKIAGAQAR